MTPMRELWMIARKDLRIERQSRVLVNQVLPFALLIIVLFGLALDADRATLRQFSPGLFWVTVLLVSLLALQRSVAIETADGAVEGLRLAGIDPWRIFGGKMLAITLQLLVLEVALVLGIVVFYDAAIEDGLLVVVVGVVAALGISAAGTLYGVVAVGLGVRETLLPILLLPILAPVLIGATRAYGDAFGTTAVNGWAWLGLLFAFAVVYTIVGAVAYGAILEDVQ